jgi:hypothetical protein
LPVDALRQVSQDEAAMNESEKQFSFTRAALSTCGRAGSKFLSLQLDSAPFGQRMDFIGQYVEQRRVLLGSELKGDGAELV